ncbi:MAG TPA: hypothetical protein GXX75_00770 [Clostridiales bacterium]|nr:hypothetical protein [Clostridiales bacterium]
MENLTIRGEQEMELISRLKSDKKERSAYTVTAAFVAMYCWYTAFWDSVNLKIHIASLGLGFNDVLAVFQVACVASVLFGFFFIRGEYLSSPRSIWITLHILAFSLMQLVALSPIKELLVISAAAGGLCIGFIGYRLFYGMFFYISKPNPVRAVAIAYIFIRTYICTYAIAPVGRFPVLFFSIQAVTLLASMILSLAFRGNDMEIRYSLRENDFQLRDTWPTLVYVAMFQICLSLYQGIIVPKMPESFRLNSYQILPSAVTLFCMLRFSRFFTITNTVRGSNTSGLDLYGKVEMTPESTGNIFVNNNFPIKASPHSIGSLSMTSLILGNVNNFIQVADGKEIQTMITKSVTWNNLGVPYLVKNPISVNGGMTEAILTLAGGVNLLFDKDTGMEIGKTGPGSLITLGTVANPVIFSSVLKQAGAWNGLHFFDQMGMSSKLEGMVLEYATNGITFEAVPGGDILKQSTIQFCKELGINKKFTDLLEYILDFMMPDLGNIFKGNGQDQN